MNECGSCKPSGRQARSNQEKLKVCQVLSKNSLCSCNDVRQVKWAIGYFSAKIFGFGCRCRLNGNWLLEIELTRGSHPHYCVFHGKVIPQTMQQLWTNKIIIVITRPHQIKRLFCKTGQTIRLCRSSKARNSGSERSQVLLKLR